MSDASWFLGFGASESLYQINRDFRQSVEMRAPDKVQADKLYTLLAQFTDECLDQYFLKPIERVKLNAVGHKVVTGGVSVMKKTIHVTLKQVVKKLSREDRQKMADYINGLLMQLSDDGEYPTYVAVGISDDLRRRLNQAAVLGKESGPNAVVSDYAEALCELIDVALDTYMAKPLSMVKLGPVLRKLSSVTVDTVRGAAQTVIRKVLPSMSEREVLRFFEFSESILYPHPQRSAAA